MPKTVTATPGIDVDPAGADSDMQIVQQVLAGDQNRFEILMRRYNNRLFRVARGLLNDQDEAMDVVQESWIAAYQSLASFRGPNGFGSWVSRITHNNALMRLRKQAKLEYQSDDDLEASASFGDNSKELLEGIAQRQLGVVLEQAVSNLPIRYRSVFVLRAVQQLNTSETALSLDLNESAVKQRYLRAKRLLQKGLASQIEDSGLTVWEFDGERCDTIIRNVFSVIQNPKYPSLAGRVSLSRDIQSLR